ncbi:MAG TPA: hypothetical protein VIG32_11085 [Candidatus Baltobacteraceae bacterium]|jgi:hypothetical protein
MRRWVESLTAADLIIWSTTFALAAVLALGISYAVWSHLPGSASVALLRVAQIALGAGTLLIGLAIPARTMRVFAIGFAVGLVASVGFVVHVFATAHAGL